MSVRAVRVYYPKPGGTRVRRTRSGTRLLRGCESFGGGPRRLGAVSGARLTDRLATRPGVSNCAGGRRGGPAGAAGRIGRRFARVSALALQVARVTGGRSTCVVGAVSWSRLAPLLQGRYTDQRGLGGPRVSGRLDALAAYLPTEDFAAIGMYKALGRCASWYSATVTVRASLPDSAATTPPLL